MIPGYEHITSKVIDGKTVVAQGAGSFQGGGPKLGLHTTEGPKAEGAITTLYRNRSWSHFLLSFEERRKIQFLELNVAGKSMSNNTIDGYPTNRSNMIQVEIVGYAAEAVSWPKEKLDWLAQCFKEIRQQFNFPLNHLDFANGVRLSDKDFHNYKGIVGHKHAPDNNHWDPGQLDVPYIVSKMGVATPPTPTFEFREEDMKTAVKDVKIGKDGKGWVAFETGAHVVACFGCLNSSNPKQRYPNFQGITVSSTTDGNQAIITVENATPNTKFGIRGFWING